MKVTPINLVTAKGQPPLAVFRLRTAGGYRWLAVCREHWCRVAADGTFWPYGNQETSFGTWQEAMDAAWAHLRNFCGTPRLTRS